MMKTTAVVDFSLTEVEEVPMNRITYIGNLQRVIVA